MKTNNHLGAIPTTLNGIFLATTVIGGKLIFLALALVEGLLGCFGLFANTWI